MRIDGSSHRPPSDRLLRLCGVVLVVLVAVWLVLRLVAGIVDLVAWLITTAVIVALLGGLLWIALGRREEG